jgi:hypothetical protein
MNVSHSNLRTNGGNLLIPCVMRLSNHEQNQPVQRFLNLTTFFWIVPNAGFDPIQKNRRPWRSVFLKWANGGYRWPVFHPRSLRFLECWVDGILSTQWFQLYCWAAMKPATQALSPTYCAVTVTGVTGVHALVPAVLTDCTCMKTVLATPPTPICVFEVTPFRVPGAVVMAVLFAQRTL